MSNISLSEKSFFTLELDLEFLPFSPPRLSLELSSSSHLSVDDDLFPFALVGDKDKGFSPKGTSENRENLKQ